MTPDSPEVAAAREAYRDACVAYCDGWKPGDWPSDYQQGPLIKAVLARRSVLETALARQQQAARDESAVAVIHAALSESRVDFWDETARHILGRLRNSGFSVRKEPAP